MKRNAWNLAAVGPVLAAFVLTTGLADLARANVRGTLVLKADNRRMTGTLRWDASARSYSITAIAAGGSTPVTLSMPFDQVARVEVDKPAGFDAAVADVRAGRYASAVAPLETIARTYWMLQWAVPATRHLAEAYLGIGAAQKAVDACQRVIRDDPNAQYAGDLAATYWQALLKSGQEATLQIILDKAIRDGSRELAGRAQLARGDIHMKNGRHKEALVDGFLRTAVLYRNIKELQPEALFKAAQCFERLQDPVNAEKMRKRLLQEYPNDSYSAQLKSGK